MLLETQGVDQLFRTGFWLKKVQILFDVNLRVPERSIFGFLGANGAGKTTLIHLIVGLRRPSAGQVLVQGLPADSLQARARMGYLPERPYFYEHLTGEAFLRYFGTLSGMKRGAIQSRITKVLSVVGMKDARGIELRKYSKGMLQRIGIAQAILHDPEFLVLDEPMSGLDPLGRKEIRELITALAGEGRTIFFSSHVIPDVEAICDQVALIQKGKLIGCGPIREFLGELGAKESGAEIVFTGVSGEKIKAYTQLESVRETADGVRALVRGTQGAQEVIAKILKDKGQVLSLTPVRPSLETYFERGAS